MNFNNSKTSQITPSIWGFLLFPIFYLYRYIRNFIYAVGGSSVLFFQAIWQTPTVFKNPSFTLQQAVKIGVASLPLVIIVSLFTGAVSAESAAYQFKDFIPTRYIGTAVGLGVILELSPVLTGLVLAGRVSSAISAEIGSMKEKEELDAMVVLHLNPIRYLAMPRILASLIMFPILTIISCFVAIVGGWLDSLWALDLTTTTYVYGLRFLFEPYHIVIAVTKALCFGAIVSTMGYYHGMHAKAGAQGVGKSSMSAVVSSSVFILIADFILTFLMLGGAL
jgi:phospholipid/cholesterol/gamma-HCH transport system permease protein